MTDSVVTQLNAALTGRYTVERELGEGGMAKVYLADDLKHERKVAIKVLNPELAALVGAERFLAEIKTTANLLHPHILPLFDSGAADGFLFYVMPFVEGETLRQRLDREKQLPVDQAVEIAADVGEGLAHAHAHGVVHRDVKPANILLHAGKPVISDFGIALAVNAGGGTRLTETGLSLGTPHYMSPEQATGDPNVGPPSDVYALGCVLYEMLVGEPPYTGSTPQAILGKIIMGRADPVTEQRAAVPPNVDAAIRRALEKVPADRFATAEDLVAALRNPGYRYGAQAADPATGTRQWRGVAALTGILALVSTAALTWTVATRDARAPESVTTLSIDLPEGDRLNLRASSAAGLAVSPDGRTVVYAGTRDGADLLFQRSLERDDVRPIPGSEQATGPFFSPDGASVGFFVDRRLLRVELAGGIPAELGELENLQHGGTWGPDGFIYFGVHESGISRIPEGGGTPELLTEVIGASVRDHKAPLVLPGARSILFQPETQSPETNFIEVQNLDTGERKRLVVGTDPTYADPYLVFNRAGTLMAVRFDADRLETVGEPYALMEGIATGDAVGGAAQYALAGGTLAYAPGATGGAALVRVDFEGAAVETLAEEALLSLPRVAPDGSRVAYISGEEIWVVDLERRIPTRISGALTQQQAAFAWLPDSRSIAFSQRDNVSAIHVVAADRPGASRPLSSSDRLQIANSWSPNGQLALYRDRVGTSRDVLVLDTTSATETVVAGTEANEMGAMFSPDGELIAYVSDETGRFEVYVQPYPGPGRREQVSSGGGTEPMWSSDGRRLYYRNGPDMMVVEVTAGPAFELGSPRLLFTSEDYDLNPSNGPGTAWYDVLPGERGFVMIRGAGQLRSQIVVVLNFLELVRRADPS